MAGMFICRKDVTFAFWGETRRRDDTSFRAAVGYLGKGDTVVVLELDPAGTGFIRCLTPRFGMGWVTVLNKQLYLEEVP